MRLPGYFSDDTILAWQDKGEHKKKAAYGFLYFFSQIDILPDFLPGLGLIDDVFVVCYVLNSMLNEIDKKFIDQYWLGDEAFT